MKYSILMVLIMLFSVSSVAAQDGSFVTYSADGKNYEGYYISPKENAPFVFMIHDWDGVTDYEIKRAQMLSDLGYAVFAVDLFGKGVRPKETEEKRRLTGELYKNREKMRALMRAGLKTAASKGAILSNGVAAGYCFGGAAVLELARSGEDLKGFVTFHGGLKTPEGQDYNGTKGKLLVLHGSADTSVTLNDFADLGSELEKSGVVHEMITYSGAPHAFTVFGSNRYRQDADQKSWARFTDFLNSTLNM